MIMEYDLDCRRITQYLSYDAFVAVEVYEKSFEELVSLRDIPLINTTELRVSFRKGAFVPLTHSFLQLLHVVSFPLRSS